MNYAEFLAQTMATARRSVREYFRPVTLAIEVVRSGIQQLTQQGWEPQPGVICSAPRRTRWVPVAAAAVITLAASVSFLYTSSRLDSPPPGVVGPSGFTPVSFAGGNGETRETAVVVLGAVNDEDAIAAADLWVEQRFGERPRGGVLMFSADGHVFHTVSINRGDGTTKRINFDITGSTEFAKRLHELKEMGDIKQDKLGNWVLEDVNGEKQIRRRPRPRSENTD